jgi:hypothetical protein
VKLSENPIFITQKRIVHRNGVLAAMLIAAMVGLCLLLGLWGNLHEEITGVDARNQMTPKEAGRVFYAWAMAIEMLVLVIGGFSRISRALADDRKAGLWDSNRLTPLKPPTLIAGYWFGPPLREFYMAVILAAFGLLITLTAGLPITVWLGTQLLVVSTALFFGLLGVLAGMAFQRSQGLMIFLVFLLAIPFSSFAPSRVIMNFLLPVYGIGYFFSDPPTSGNVDSIRWNEMPEIFGIPVHPVILSLGLQLITGAFIWRALNRKTANPFQPLLLRWEAIALFTIFSVTQHALLWDLWGGKYPTLLRSNQFVDQGVLLPVVLAVTMFVGVLLLASASPQPEHVRVESLRLGFKNLGAIFSRSAVSLALALAGIAGAGMLTQFVFAPRDSWPIFAVVTINLTEIFLVFALLVEFCRLRHGRRALGFMVLWLFLLCAVPFILAGAFSNEEFARLSLLAPGFFALSADSETEWSLLLFPLGVHLGVVFLMFLGWGRQWTSLLKKAS